MPSINLENLTICISDTQLKLIEQSIRCFERQISLGNIQPTESSMLELGNLKRIVSKESKVKNAVSTEGAPNKELGIAYALEKVSDLHKKGSITSEEFAKFKTNILGE